MSDTEETIKEEDIKVEIKFKKRGNKNLRQKVKEESEDEEEEIRPQIEGLKEIQNLRKRQNGVSIVGLALGSRNKDEEIKSSAHSGGMVNMQALKTGKLKTNDEYDTGIGTQFSVETNKRDEDEEMMKYIEEQLSKRKGGPSDDASADAKDDSLLYKSPEEAALQAVPKHLRESSAQRSEEMLSNQMLSGIPEVDLGIEAKIKNIEATEEAKLKLLRESLKKKDGPSQFVPSNMAVNFIQHNRFSVDDTQKKRKQQPQETNKDKGKPDKATDDFHYERFKKQFRKH